MKNILIFYCIFLFIVLNISCGVHRNAKIKQNYYNAVQFNNKKLKKKYQKKYDKQIKRK